MASWLRVPGLAYQASQKVAGWGESAEFCAPGLMLVSAHEKSATALHGPLTNTREECSTAYSSELVSQPKLDLPGWHQERADSPKVGAVHRVVGLTELSVIKSIEEL